MRRPPPLFQIITVITLIHKRQQYNSKRRINQHHTRDLPEYKIPCLKNIRSFRTSDHIDQHIRRKLEKCQEVRQRPRDKLHHAE